MSGFTKISTAIVAVFISCFLLFTCLVYFHIQNNIEEEMTGALNQVREMVRRNVPVSDIEAIVKPSPHLSAKYFSGRLSTDQTQVNIVNQQNVLVPVIIPIKENQNLFQAHLTTPVAGEPVFFKYIEFYFTHYNTR